MGQPTRAAVSLPRIPRLHSVVGRTGRSRLGACPRILPGRVCELQRHSGGEARAARAVGVAAPMKSDPHTVRRVLMTADTVGGVWSYALELSRALGKCGVEVGLAT